MMSSMHSYMYFGLNKSFIMCRTSLWIGLIFVRIGFRFVNQRFGNMLETFSQ